MANPKTLKPFKKGHDPRRNLNGRPKGTRSFKTIFIEAAKAVAESLKLGKEPDKIQIEIVKRGIAQALKGNYSFYKDILDRLYGQAKQIVETEEKKILVLTDEEDEEKNEEVKEEKNN
jgi:DNA polymerase III sliding clamp (beta) subunit (PCNA family)